jgi:aconitate hydratase
LETAEGTVDLFRLDALDADLARLPKTVLILLENLLRRAGSRDVSDDDARALAAWPGPAQDVAFMPGRVLMQDFTGVPAVVDLAAMRSAAQRGGADPMAIEPSIPVDLVIDHSVQVDLSAIRCCGGRSRRSRAFASCRRAPASATR